MNISIHSPRMGRDRVKVDIRDPRAISIHSPRMGRDKTLATKTDKAIDFNPLSPHGERLDLPCLFCKCYISIHSPRMGRDRI